MRRWSVLLLGAALVLLASLYLPWEKAPCGPGCTPGRIGVPAGLINPFSVSLNGWLSGVVGDAAGLLALLLAAVAAVALARPKLEGRLPLRLCALLAGYFGFAVAAQARSVAHHSQPVIPGTSFHYAYGAYLGVAAAVVALVSAGAMQRHDLGRARSPSPLATIVLGVCLLVSFLLPWERLGSSGTFLGIATPAAVVAAALGLCMLEASLRGEAAARTKRLALAAVACLFTGAAFSTLTYPAARAYGAWIGLGVAIALVALAIASGIELPSVQAPRWRALATAGAAALLVTGMFLPRQTVCFEKASRFGRDSGRCITANGWTSTLGTAAALLAIVLLVVIVAARRFPPPVVLAAGVGLLVASMGFQLEDGSVDGYRLAFGYGSTIVFVAAGLLLALAVAGSRPPKLGGSRLAVRLVPIAACVAYLAVVVLPWWDVLPADVQSALRFAPVSWLTIAGVLLAIWLVELWVERIASAAAGADRLVIVPLALLSLAALDLIRFRDGGITWGGGIVVGLCLLLALLGWIERQAGLENARVPEVLRLDRL